jgi:hypothetical protein
MASLKIEVILILKNEKTAEGAAKSLIPFHFKNAEKKRE